MGKSIHCFELNTGAKIPSVGLGTSKAAPRDVGDAVNTAVEIGVSFAAVRNSCDPPRTVQNLDDSDAKKGLFKENMDKGNQVSSSDSDESSMFDSDGSSGTSTSTSESSSQEMSSGDNRWTTKPQAGKG